jgi:mRNA interferase RelE/StbE
MNAPYRVELVKRAVKEYQAVPDHERQNLKKAILHLETDPRNAQVKKLTGGEYYRLRVGDWRVIFALSDKLKVVTIISVERRTSTTY